MILGVLAGLLAVLIVKGLALFEDGFERLPVPSFWHPVIGALGSLATSANALGLRQVMTEDVATLPSTVTLHEARLHFDDAVHGVRVLEEGVEALPVVNDDDRLVGICTRTDILRARRHQLELEEREPSSFRLPPRLRFKEGPR